MALNTITLSLYKVPFSFASADLMMFTSAAAKENYFNTNFSPRVLPNQNYMRKNAPLVVDLDYATTKTYNYVAYTQDGKRYYYFITNHKQINEQTTEITIMLDSWTTYEHDLVFLPSFVERMHGNTDAVGDNLQEEKEIAALNNTNVYRMLNSDGSGVLDLCDVLNPTYALYMATFSKDRLNTATGDTAIHTFSNCGKIHQTQIYFVRDYDDVHDFMIYHALQKTVDGVINITYPNFYGVYFLPRSFFPEISPSLNNVFYPIENLDMSTLTVYGVKESVLRLRSGNYYPNNKKLLTHLFRKLKVYTGNTNSGNELPYSITPNTENLEITKSRFIGDTAPTIAIDFPQLTEYGVNYTMLYDRFQKFSMLNLGNPEQAAALEAQRNQNALSAGLGALGSIISIAGGIAGAAASGGSTLLLTAGGVTSLTSQMSGAFAQNENTTRNISNLSHISNMPKSTSSVGDIMTNTSGFLLQWEIPEDETVYQLDNYFSKYGYAQNKVKSPDPHNSTRPRYCYIKTNGARLGGDIPNEDINAITKMFDNGVTFWRDSAINSYANNNV